MSLGIFDGIVGHVAKFPFGENGGGDGAQLVDSDMIAHAERFDDGGGAEKLIEKFFRRNRRAAYIDVVEMIINIINIYIIIMS